MALETKRKLIKFSNYSFCITLPKEAVDHMGWKKGETLNVVFEDDASKIIVSKGKGKSTGGTPKLQKSEPERPVPSMNSDIQPIPKLRW